jgi:hypothetical protein
LDKTLDIEMCGSGRYIESIEVNGQLFQGTNKLPSDAFIKKNEKHISKNEKHTCIKVKRVKESPYQAYIKQASGLEFIEYNYRENQITVKIKGAGTSRIKIAASGDLLVKLNGEKVDVQYDKSLMTVTVEVVMRVNEIKMLEVCSGKGRELL